MWSKVKGYKMLFVNMAIASIGVAMQFAWIDVIPAAWTGLVLAALGGINMWLRAITDTPIFKTTSE